MDVCLSIFACRILRESVNLEEKLSKSYRKIIKKKFIVVSSFGQKFFQKNKFKFYMKGDRFYAKARRKYP